MIETPVNNGSHNRIRPEKENSSIRAYNLQCAVLEKATQQKGCDISKKCKPEDAYKTITHKKGPAGP